MKRKKIVDKLIEIDVPVETAYNQWADVGKLPHFMPEVVSVRQTGETSIHWTAIVEGTPHEWTTQITEQIPNKRITWNSEEEGFSVHISFHSLEPNKTQVRLYAMGGGHGPGGGWPRRFPHHLADGIERFKEFIASRGNESDTESGTVI
jgi:uncharacterized membrane protein